MIQLNESDERAHHRDPAEYPRVLREYDAFILRLFATLDQMGEGERGLRGLQDNGLAILLVEQSTERVLHVASSIAVLESGRLAWTGSGQRAAQDSAIVDAYLGLGEG